MNDEKLMAKFDRSKIKDVKGQNPEEPEENDSYNTDPMDIVRKAPEHGWIEVITGSMFSGKSEELIRRLRRAQIGQQKGQIFKPLLDDPVSEGQIRSHTHMRIAPPDGRTFHH